MTPERVNELARCVTPQSARSYANANGWRRLSAIDRKVAVFGRANADLNQLLIPLEPGAPDYVRRIVDVATVLSETECRSIEEVLNDLLMPEADVLRYRISSTDARKGDLSLHHIIGILEGAKRSLLAAACSVISPERHHPRMSRTEATQLFEATRFRQTERGSFTIAIACPLRAVETGDSLFDSIDPFTRRTTVLLMRSVADLADAIESDNTDRIGESSSDGPPLSANLCEAVLRMQPPEEDGTLSISANWASTLPLDPQIGMRQCVTFQHDYFPIIEDVFKKLRPASQPTSSLFIGYVDTLNGDVGEAGRVQGDTTVSVLHEEEIMKARLDLGADDYDKAINAHRRGGFVKFAGVLHRGRRTHKITDVQEFDLVRERDGG